MIIFFSDFIMPALIMTASLFLPFRFVSFSLIIIIIIFGYFDG